MKNLAGVEDCDEHIRKELTEAGITIVDASEHKGEVPYRFIGVLGMQDFNEMEHSVICQYDPTRIYAESSSFSFRRAWYYWVVVGYVPLYVAEELYNDPVGKKDVRVEGHCACPPPEEWATKHKICGHRVINSYHIDSQEGLNLFVITLKKYNLV